MGNESMEQEGKMKDNKDHTAAEMYEQSLEEINRQSRIIQELKIENGNWRQSVELHQDMHKEVVKDNDELNQALDKLKQLFDVNVGHIKRLEKEITELKQTRELYQVERSNLYKENERFKQERNGLGVKLREEVFKLKQAINTIHPLAKHTASAVCECDPEVGLVCCEVCQASIFIKLPAVKCVMEEGDLNG